MLIFWQESHVKMHKSYLIEELRSFNGIGILRNTEIVTVFIMSIKISSFITQTKVNSIHQNKKKKTTKQTTNAYKNLAIDLDRNK